VIESDLTAVIFPGQGSQRGEMRDLVAGQNPELLARVVAAVGSDPFERIEEGTAFQQPALYCAAISGWQAAGSPRGDFIAGHSLGELAAAAAAGAITVEDGLDLAVARGRAMQEAAQVEPGAMLAVLGRFEGTGLLATTLGLTVANDNAPDQVVLSGSIEEIKEARRRFKEAGIRTVRLPVAGAFHSPAMHAAEPAFREALDAVEVREPETCLVSSVTAAPARDLRAGLLAALTSPVRWRETVLGLRASGVSRFLESGPGHVLSGLVGRTVEGIEARSLTEDEPLFEARPLPTPWMAVTV